MFAAKGARLARVSAAAVPRAAPLAPTRRLAAGSAIRRHSSAESGDGAGGSDRSSSATTGESGGQEAGSGAYGPYAAKRKPSPELASRVGGGADSDDRRRRRQLVEEILRVDHAGEYGAVRIYQGQIDMLRGTPAGPVIKDMKTTEDIHLAKMEELVGERRVRPTLLMPLWHVAGYALGAGTALLGKETAMACTVAVEEAIGEHYNDQIRELIELGYTEDDEELVHVLSVNRDEELEHLQTAIDNDAEKAPLSTALSAVIKAGCKIAIEVTKRV